MAQKPTSKALVGFVPEADVELFTYGTSVLPLVFTSCITNEMGLPEEYVQGGPDALIDWRF
jgi:hypothetical protein